MKQITFENIYILGEVVAENETYKHYHYPEMLIRYDSNFIEFKHIPTLAKFKVVEAYLREFHLNRNQKHTKFYFPENERLTDELMTYLTQSGYDIGILELYTIEPQDFPAIPYQADIDIQVVTEETLAELIDLQYKSDIEFGVKFAKAQAKLTKRQFNNPEIEQVLAFYKGMPVGYVELIISETTVEIDNLTVEAAFRHQGIGSRLQEFVMHTFPEKTVILVADGEDTPREMYQKQNYTYCGFQYEAEKIDEIS